MALVPDGSWLFGHALLAFGAPPTGENLPPFAGRHAPARLARMRSEPLTLAWAPPAEEPLPMRGVLLGVALGLALWALLVTPVILALA